MLGNWKTVIHERDTLCNSCSRYSHQRIGTGTGGLINKRTNGDHQNNSIIKNGQNTEKSHGDMWRLAVTQTPVENHQLTLIRKTLKKVIIIEIIIISNIMRRILIIYGRTHGVVANVFDRVIVVCSNSSHAITFIFGQILRRKVWTSSPHPSYEVNSITVFFSTNSFSIK